MRVIEKRWGEITIKKQGGKKNDFDATKSFSVSKTRYEYTIEQLKEIYAVVTNLSEKYSFEDMKKRLLELDGKAAEVKDVPK